MLPRSSVDASALREAQKALGRNAGSSHFGTGRLRRLPPNVKGLLIGSFVFLLFGVFMFPWIAWINRRVEQMLKWPIVQASVVATDTSFSFRRIGSGYTQKIQYRYAVDGREHVGDRVSYGDGAPRWPTRSQAAANLPKIGAPISIRYDPRNPDDSVIYVFSTSPGMTNYMLWLVGLIGFAGGVLMVLSGMSLLKERR